MAQVLKYHAFMQFAVSDGSCGLPMELRKAAASTVKMAIRQARLAKPPSEIRELSFAAGLFGIQGILHAQMRPRCRSLMGTMR